jgi:ABC-2 type transport system ATP-binding protein
MSGEACVIEIKDLVRKYGRTDAVNGLSLKVAAGKCYGFFGRNGAGKTTTIKCLLNLLQPTSGTVRVFGLDPRRDEVAVKTRIAYVPDQVAFYPWMTVRDTLDYLASFRKQWNKKTENELLDQFRFWMNRRRAWIQSCAANSSRPSLARIRKPIPASARYSSRRISSPNSRG